MMLCERNVPSPEWKSAQQNFRQTSQTTPKRDWLEDLFWTQPQWTVDISVQRHEHTNTHSRFVTDYMTL